MTEPAVQPHDVLGNETPGFDRLHHDALESGELAGALALVTEGQRSLAAELVVKLKDTRLLRTGVPTALGGPQAPPGAILRSAETIARGDMSAGWCVSIAATSSLLAAYLPAEGASEVFGEPQSVAAGVWAPGGQGKPVDGGVVLSGRWSFCSGIAHSDWLFAGFLLGTPDGPLMRVAAVPTAELEILDTWHTGGLRGTGSTDAVATEVFVPEHRLLSVLDGPPADASPLHRFPLFGFFALSIGAATLGNARGAIDDLVAVAGSKKSLGSSRSLAERTTVQSAVAQAEAALRAARLLFFQSVEDAWRAAQQATPVSDSLRVGLRLAATHATRTSAEVTRSMYDLAGGTAIYENSPLQRRFRDAHTATAHFQVSATSYEVPGRLLLGLPTRTEQL
ncbi:MAG TPA: acyl-CoA dehydrogenase family protein [Pseudonocardiaceae bacterium]|nr:acyl-CoA dehydrogenase family protein [Pseudonocardiaceae bacterium]